MAEKQDYYELLGVERDASSAHIRKAYKKLALKYHPDRNAGCSKSAQAFKEVTEAYAVLSDDDKRSRYDQFGHAGVDGAVNFGNAGDVFSQFQDLFSNFFGNRGGPQRRGPSRGRDMRVEQVLTLEEAALGIKKELTINTPVLCESC
ncbi:MAG TPA: molecular chaperone DnaJ, partial [Sorangium sp.]|nr:molecular chaperone DnaJ [Sorangium sp.]